MTWMRTLLYLNSFMVRLRHSKMLELGFLRSVLERWEVPSRALYWWRLLETRVVLWLQRFMASLELKYVFFFPREKFLRAKKNSSRAGVETSKRLPCGEVLMIANV